MENKKLKIIRILQIILVFILAGFVVLTVYSIQLQEGTARVVNYAGIVRGSTQRLVKLEIAGQKNEKLEAQIDMLLNELKNGGMVNNIQKLDDEAYQISLTTQMGYWEKLKSEIGWTRLNGYENTNIINYSEIYYELANNTVSAAEEYSDELVKRSEFSEYGMIGSGLLMILLSFYSLRVSRQMIKKNENEIRNQAEHDEMTGLLNRRAFDQLYEYYVSHGVPIALHIIDVDNFKRFNDDYGHSTGDQVLRKVARCIAETYRFNDFTFRIGGDEFAVMMIEMSAGLRYAAENKIQNLMNAINDPDPENELPTVTLSIGAAFSDDVAEKSRLFDAADQALYQAKKNGRNGYFFYER